MALASVEVRRLADQVADVPHDTLVLAVMDVKRLANGAAPPFTHARKGSSYPLWVYDDREDHPGYSTARIQGVPVGFWSMATYGTGRHRIAEPYGASLKRSRARQLGKTGRRLLTFGPGQAAWGPVTHPGARGSGVWDRMVARAIPMVLARFDQVIDEALV